MKWMLALGSALAMTLGCEGDGSDGSAPVIVFEDTPECIVFAGGFPPGFVSLPGSGREAAVVQSTPTAILGLDLDREPPRLLADESIPGFPLVSCGACGGLPGVDSDGDGIADACRSDALGFRCLSPQAGSLTAIDADLVALSTSNYEEIAFLDPRNGEPRSVQVATPPASAAFDPADWPFWPAAGQSDFRTAASTRVCIYTSLPDSLGDPLGPNTRCDASRDGFETRFTAGSTVQGDQLFVTTSNLLRSSQARYAPGTVLVFDFDRSVDPPLISPAATGSVIFTSGYDPTAVTTYTTPSGRDLILVGVSGAIALGTGPDLVRSDSAVDVIDAATRTLIATIPLGPAGLSAAGIRIDATRRIGLVGAFTSRALFGIDLAALDDPDLGLGPDPLPIVLDGSTPGFPDARIYDAALPFVLPKRANGPSEDRCATLTTVALSQLGPWAVTSDFCDGTVSVLDLELPASRTTAIDPNTLLSVDRVVEVAAPIVDSTTGLLRAIDGILIRPGQPGLDFIGPDVYFTAGLPEGALCGVRINAL